MSVGVISDRAQPLEIGPRSAYFAPMDTAQKPVSALTLQLLIDRDATADLRRRHEAWRTSCPRMPTEDVSAPIEVNGSGLMRDRKVTLSVCGVACLAFVVHGMIPKVIPVFEKIMLHKSLNGRTTSKRVITPGRHRPARAIFSAPRRASFCNTTRHTWAMSRLFFQHHHMPIAVNALVLQG